MSIYAHTKCRLQSHSVEKTADGRLTLSDHRLFLLFVNLERGVRAKDFAYAQSAVDALKVYLEGINKRHLLVFAYMYLGFSFGGSSLQIENGPEGKMTRTKTFQRHLCEDEILIKEWAWLMFKRCERQHFFSIVYRSAEEGRVFDTQNSL